MHLLGCALEEASTSSDEQSISGEDGLVLAILEQVANAVLSVAWRVQSLDLDVLPDCEAFSVLGRLGHLVTVFTTDDGQRVSLEHLDVAPSMVVVAVMF